MNKSIYHYIYLFQLNEYLYPYKLFSPKCFMKKLFLSFLLIFHGLLLLSQENIIKNYIHIGKHNGLCHNSITHTTEDIYKRIWIGTEKGLHIYYGNRLTKVERFAEVFITSLYNTGETMLIGTPKTLYCYDYETGIYTHLCYQKNELDYAYSFVKDGNRIIFLSGHCIYSYENRQIKQLCTNISYKKLSIDKFGIIWAINTDKAYRLNNLLKIDKTYQLKSSDSSPLTSISLFPDSKGCVWVGTAKDGLYRYNRAIDDFHKENLKNINQNTEIENIGSINEDGYDRLWIGHNSGVAVYDYTNNWFKNYTLGSRSIPINITITDILRTHNGNMVLGTYFTGLFYINELDTEFKFYTLTGPTSQTGGITANSIIKDTNGNLLVSTNCKGIYKFNLNQRIIDEINQTTVGINDNILTLAIDSNANLWAGAMQAGLYKIDNKRKISHYVHYPNNLNALSGSAIYCIYVFNKDSLLIASEKGIDIYQPDKDTFSNILKCKQDDYAFSNIKTYKNKLYLFDFSGFYCYDRTNKKVSEYDLRKFAHYIQCGHVSKNGQIWLGTSKGEVFIYKDSDSLIPIVDKKAMIESSISNMQEDSDGNLWFTAGNEIYCILPDKEIKKINLSWGLGNNEFNIRSSYKDREGIIYFGTNEGLVSFNPKHIQHSSLKAPALYVSAFSLFNKVVIPDNNSPILKKTINNTQELNLANKQNSISFIVNCIDYNTNWNIPYKCMYQLEKFDSNWHEINPVSNEIIFTHLQTGNYILHLKLETSTGTILQEKNIRIKINPPLLATPQMLLLYAIIAILLGWLIIRFFKRQNENKQLIDKTQREKEEIEKLNAMKLDFFTYISHEFKTPLNIISTVQDEIFTPSNDEEQNFNQTIFKRSVNRLEYLINQLMNYRAMESQHLPIENRKYDLILFLRNIYDMFIPLYKRKGISFHFDSEKESLLCIFDADKMEMLIGNLLSNSFKHTQIKGDTYLKVYMSSSAEQIVTIDVFNSGPCLTEEEKKAIFHPFSRLKTSNRHSNSGIGLAIVNSITKMLNIQLNVITVENKGNIFRIKLNLMEDNNSETALLRNHTNIVNSIIDNTIYSEEQENNESTINNDFKKANILLVENDNDTLKLLKKKLEGHLHVFTASNAREALLMMKSQCMDIVISDIFMPEKDGYELCKIIKANEQTKHVPIILITSDLSSETKIKSLQTGADAFLTKPINIQELFLWLNNILQNKNTLRSYYYNMNYLNIESKEITNADEAFIHQITQYIYEHLSDGEVSVQQLASHINISRTQLYLNIKNLSGQTPSSFVLNIKMQEAKRMMLNTNMTSSEISYKLGYCNPNHFSRQFKEYYGISPTEFRKQKKQG